MDSYRYYAHIFPSQMEEMVKIGALSYSSTFIFRDHLKQAIMTHPSWQQNLRDGTPLIFDLFVSDFLSPGKCTKTLFVSAEKTKQDEVSSLFKQIYDGTGKSYPNGYMLLYIPIQDIVTSTPEVRAKIAFNHEQYIGDEALLSIAVLNDLNTSVLLKNGKKVTI
jgi:hypothetical protein